MTKAPQFLPGWHFHPCHPNSKKPILDNWPTLASDDPAQIAAWAAEYPGCNWALACGPSGVSVIDIDGSEGENSLADFEIAEGCLPETREHRSARGGRHLIFSDPARTLRNSASRLGPHLDTRGQNGFIIIPPSTFEGTAYEVIEDRPIAALPEFVVAALGRERERAKAPNDIILDDPRNVGRAVKLLRDYVEYGHVAVQGQGGDELTYALACEIISLGLSDDKAFDIIAAEWNAHCVPPWPTDELRAKIENAGLYAQNERGAFAVAPTEVTFKVALESLLPDSTTAKPEATGATLEAQGWTFGLHDPVADADLRPVTYRDRNRLWPDSPGMTVSQVIAGPKEHKTNFIMAELFRLMLGGAKVLMLALEGSYGVRTMRLKALAAHYDIPLANLRGRFQIVEIKAGGMFDMSDPSCVAAFAVFARAGGWTDVFIDTQHRAAGALDENSATDQRIFWNNAERLRAHGNCNLIFAHHTGKDKAKGGRGSSADLASVDQQIALDFDRDTMTVTAKVTARKDGVDGFDVPFKVLQANENSVPILEAITAAEAAALVASKETFSAGAVASALAALEVVGQARAVASRALVQEILVRRGELPQDAELCEKAINNGVKRLGTCTTAPSTRKTLPTPWPAPHGPGKPYWRLLTQQRAARPRGLMAPPCCHLAPCRPLQASK